MDNEQQAVVERRLFDDLLKQKEIFSGGKTEQEAREIIKEKVLAERYLAEPWQVDYAVERTWSSLGAAPTTAGVAPAKKGKSVWPVLRRVLVDVIIALILYAIVGNIVSGALVYLACQAVVSGARSTERGRKVVNFLVLALIIFPIIAVGLGSVIEMTSTTSNIIGFSVAVIVSLLLAVVAKKVWSVAVAYLKSKREKFDTVSRFE